MAMLSLLSACGAVSGGQMERLDPAAGDASPEGLRNTYEVFVYSFRDSDGDGIGDLKGVTEELGYIKDLGFSRIWLSPVCPSPSYHKYDVTDYMAVDPSYGTMDDFDELVSKAHEMDIQIICDFVMNHTSSQHPWFEKACEDIRALPAGAELSDADTAYISRYNFSKEYADGYTALEGTEWYYESRFWSEMPDVNLSNEDVRRSYEEAAAFWLSHGVDGFRLDATTYYCATDSENIEVLSSFNSYVKGIRPDAYIVCEAWTDSSSYISYLSSGVDSMFNFDFSGKSGAVAKTAAGSMSVKTFADQLGAYEERIAAESPGATDAPFYTNHDCARSAGYYSAGDYVSQIKLAGALNLLMSGNAFVYYGEELGMKGSGKDENFRAPMQWSTNPSAEGMCRGPEDMDSVKMPNGSLEEQKDDPLSIMNYYRHALHIRNAFPVISTGRTRTADELCSEKAGAFIREKEGYDPLLIVINNTDEEYVCPLPASYRDYNRLAAVLLTGEDEVTLKGGKLSLPPYGIAFLTKE